MNRKQHLIQLIHIAKAQLMLSDDEYRALLAAEGGGKKSSTKLSVAELEEVLRALKAQGFVVMQRQRRRADLKIRADESDHIKKLRSLWLELRDAGALRDASEQALTHWVSRQLGRKTALAWLSTHETNYLIESAKQWLGRVQKQEEQHDR